MVAITKVCPSQEKLLTQHGMITYIGWLEKERRRINKNPKRNTEIVHIRGGVCLVEKNYNSLDKLARDMNPDNILDNVRLRD